MSRQIGGYRATAAAIDPYATRLVFQSVSVLIADSVLEHCQVKPSRTAPISTIPVHQSDQFGNGWPRASGQGFARRKERFYRPLLLFPPHSS
jgi:hypothetical protein